MHWRRKDRDGSTGERNNTQIILGARGKTGVWHRMRKDTDGSTGERKNKNYMGGKREDRGVAQEEERYRWEYW